MANREQSELLAQSATISLWLIGLTIHLLPVSSSTFSIAQWYVAQLFIQEGKSFNPKGENSFGKGTSEDTIYPQSLAEKAVR